MKQVCIVGASGKLGRYMVQHSLDRDYRVVAVGREQSVGKLEAFKDRIAIIPGDRRLSVTVGDGTCRAGWEPSRPKHKVRPFPMAATLSAPFFNCLCRDGRSTDVRRNTH